MKYLWHLKASTQDEICQKDQRHRIKGSQHSQMRGKNCKNYVARKFQASSTGI